MNQTIQLLQNHRSIRRFQDKPIDPLLFEQIIKAGQAASTSSYIQATSVIRIQDPLMREKMVTLTGEQKYVGSAAEFLVVCADLNRNWQRIKTDNPGADFSWTEQFLAATVDVALFAQNIVIAAESTGLGCCYIGGIRNNPEQVSELLKLPNLVYPVFGLCLGYPDQDPEIKPRLPMEVVVHQENYQYSSKEADLIDQYDAEIRQYYRDRTGGKLDFSWSEQMRKQAATQSRYFMKEFINNKGLATK